MTNQEEKQLLREIENLKKAIPSMKAMNDIEPQIQKIKAERKKLQTELDRVKEIIDEKEEKIQSVKS